MPKIKNALTEFNLNPVKQASKNYGFMKMRKGGIFDSQPETVFKRHYQTLGEKQFSAFSGKP